MSQARVGLVADLWRYPVKSFGGERIRGIFVGPYGFHGDRRFAAVTPDGALLTARRKRAMLGFRARFPDPDRIECARVTTPGGQELAVDDPDLARLLARELGRDAQMARSGGGVFDAAPIHIVTDRSLRQIDAWVGQELDVARFRPNVVIELEPDLPAFVEANWIDRVLVMGQVEVRIVSPTERCAVTTIDPDTLDRDRAVLAHLAVERDNLFGIYARVTAPGWLHIGETVTLRRTPPEVT